MSSISIRNNFPAIAARLDRLPEQIANKAMVRALNKTVDQGKTEMARQISVSDLVSDGMAYGSAMSGEHDRPELYAALQLICSEKVHSRRAGNWLRVHRDRIVDGMRLEQVEVDRKGIARWRVTA